MLQICKGLCSPQPLPLDHRHTRTVSIHGLTGVESAFHSKGSTLKRTNAFRRKLRKGKKLCEKKINNHSGITQRQRDVGPVVTTQRYHNNGRLIMLEVNCIKFSLDIPYSLGIIMCKFLAVQSKTEGMAASVCVFVEHPS